ncbi:MAG: hypothetical protein U0326_16560 [Polyangiales bacterium]
MNDGPLRRALGAAILTAYAVAVGVSAFAGPLGYGGNAIWPFNRNWWMFHRESGRFQHLRFIALFDDGRRDEVSLDAWFTFRPSRATLRYDELSRDLSTMRDLARWACAKHNRDASPNDRWRALSISDTSWAQTEGLRVPFAEVPYGARAEVSIVFEEPCAGGVR